LQKTKKMIIKQQKQQIPIQEEREKREKRESIQSNDDNEDKKNRERNDERNLFFINFT